MFKALKNPTSADKRALAIFLGIALLCAIYFSSGVLVSYVSPPEVPIEMAKDGAGFVVRVEGIDNFEMALQMSNTMREQRRLQALIDPVVRDKNYALRIGPVATKEMADRLVTEMEESGKLRTHIIETCPPGRQCPPAETAGEKKR